MAVGSVGWSRLGKNSATYDKDNYNIREKIFTEHTQKSFFYSLAFYHLTTSAQSLNISGGRTSPIIIIVYQLLSVTSNSIELYQIGNKSIRSLPLNEYPPRHTSVIEYCKQK